MLTTLTALRAAAEETRLRLILLLARGEMTVGELADCVNQSQPRVSRHLKLLVDAGLLTRLQEGTQVFYRLATSGPVRWIIDGITTRDGEQDFADDQARRASILAARQDRARAYFETHAATWNHERANLVDAAQIERVLVDLAAAGPEDSLLDIGTGTGRIIELFGPFVASALGVDQSREMLAIARVALGGSQFAHCSVRQGDMYALPLEDSAMTLITLHQVLHFAENPQAVITEAARVLAPGGRLLVVDYLPHNREQLRSDHAHRRLGFADGEIRGYARAAGLVLHHSVTVEGGDLPVGLWRFADKD